MKLDYFGFNTNFSYIINKKVGILDENNKSYYTSLNDLFNNNYILKLLKAFKNNDYQLINIFFTFITEMLSEYLNCLKLINQDMNFIHTDFKCLNIFIKKISISEKQKKNIIFL